MSAALIVLSSAAAASRSAESAAPDAGVFAAVIIAAGVTALVALGMMIFAMHRSARLTGLTGLATAGLALGVVTIAVGGVLAVSPTVAQASPDDAARYVVTSSTDGPDLQLPTLAE